MLNQIVLVGRIVENKNKGFITIAIPRYYKNEDGVYDTDNIKCKLSEMIEANTKEYTKKGDVIGIKGRVEEEDGIMYILAEKVTILGNNK